MYSWRSLPSGFFIFLATCRIQSCRKVAISGYEGYPLCFRMCFRSVFRSVHNGSHCFCFLDMPCRKATQHPALFCSFHHACGSQFADHYRRNLQGIRQEFIKLTVDRSTIRATSSEGSALSAGSAIRLAMCPDIK